MIYVNDAEELGVEIKFKRQLLRTTRKELAKQTKAYLVTPVTQGTIKAFENGSIEIIEDMFKILDAVGLEVILRDMPGSHR